MAAARKKTRSLIAMFILAALIAAFLASVPAPQALYSPQLTPKFTGTYYAAEGIKYFDTLDSYAPRTSKPAYSSHVIRWEWPPWLYLTGHKAHWMAMDRLLVLFPTRVINRDCRSFPVQPFCRCRVTFHYEWIDSYVDIYEEFTFNDAGEITFIEVWTDENGLRPMTAETDFWAEAPSIRRLSTRVPGLGRPDGRHQLKSRHLPNIKDPDLLNLQMRLKVPVIAWLLETLRFSLRA